ncbi:MAG: type II toxin-antitoxin system RatA family toxin [Methyloligellaceae bacterium]
MKQFASTQAVGHSAEHMFALVSDVERYPEFVPLCEGLSVLSRNTDAQGNDQLTARMSVAYKMFHESFISRVTLFRDDYRVLVEYVDGPFRHLENRWRFTPTGDGGCRIDFYIEYEFASKALQLLVGSVFEKAFAKFVDAFKQRADQVYGIQVAESASPRP